MSGDRLVKIDLDTLEVKLPSKPKQGYFKTGRGGNRGAHFLSKMVHRRVGGWTSGRSLTV